MLFQNDLEEMTDLSEIRQEVMWKVAFVTEKVLNYRNTYDSYSYLWTDDRSDFMRQFLLYGRLLTSEDIEAHEVKGFPESPPTGEQFKEQARSNILHN